MVFSSPSGIQHFVIFAAQPYGLPLKEVTIAQYLKALGYKTYAVGKVLSLTSWQFCRRVHYALLEIKIAAAEIR